MYAVRRTTRAAQSLALLALPHGGQRVARRNAWASMSADATWARNRREAWLALDRALINGEESASASAQMRTARR